MSENQVPSTIVIFGATGDLTHRKLIPALFNQYCKNNLPDKLHIVGFAIEDYTSEVLREHLKDGVQEFAEQVYQDESWQQFEQDIHYAQGNLKEVADFKRLEAFLSELEGGKANRLYYLAISPTFIADTIQNLGKAEMQKENNGTRKIIIEKPYGRDLASAEKLNDIVHSVFQEQQVYRIDHYLGKETAQNILFFRFANMVFESVWDRAHIDSAQITVAESVDVGHRAGYYDKAGVLRDMFQNHLLQLLTLVAMEPPASFNANELRNEKVKVLKAVRPLDLQDAIAGQYNGYCETEGVADNSLTPTYAALKLYIDNWRWQNVPFYLRSGKALKQKTTEIVIQFKRPPRMMFDLEIGQKCTPNLLSLCIQPDEGIHFKFEAKVPSEHTTTEIVDMEFHYSDSFDNIIPEAYERLLVDALNGDASLFIRSDEIEEAWKIVDPVIKGWENGEGHPLVAYQPGTWGPDEAESLLKDDGFYWHLSCIHRH